VVDLLIQGPQPAGEYLGEKAETAFKRPSLTSSYNPETLAIETTRSGISELFLFGFVGFHGPVWQPRRTPNLWF